MIIGACSINHILLLYIYLSSGQQQLSTNRKKQLGILSGDFNEYLTVIPDKFCMTSYIKKRLKVI